MTQEEKSLLLKDLSARLPYGVIGEYSWKGNGPYNRELTGNLYDELNSSWSSTEDSKFIPYLRPMSSMTEEEKDKYNETREYKYVDDDHYEYFDTLDTFDWLNKKMFDYRKDDEGKTMIEKGLAIEALEGMYDLNNK